ncbi:GrpB family protein [Thalassotalea ganghwensis]
MSDQSIKIVSYNPAWVATYQSERDFLSSLLGDYVQGSIEHVGSTSVVGMVAKPIIDIMVGVKSLDASKGAIELLSDNSYCYYPYKSELMHWFCKPSPEIRTHHLHLVPYNSRLWIERIAFRNLLRTNPSIAFEYATLKKELAQKFINDREAYTQFKWPFIKKALDSVGLKPIESN